MNLSPNLRICFGGFLIVGTRQFSGEVNVMLSSLLAQTLRPSIGERYFPTGTISIGDYWEETVRNEHINVKEMWAVLKGLQSLPESVSDCRKDVQVDSMVVCHAWSGPGPRSRNLTQISQFIFQFSVDRNLSLKMSFVTSHLNQADWFSRKLSRPDAMLSPKSWEIVQRRFGGISKWPRS